MYIQTYQSPVGALQIVADNKKLHGLVFYKNWCYFKQKFEPLTERENLIIKKTRQQLDEYFSGKRKNFNLPISLNGTNFQNKVWRSLGKIPFGKTWSYKEQAKYIQREKSVRAVGRTNGFNPICIILPCHRVIGSNGALTGYAAGIKTKKFLIEFENEQLSSVKADFPCPRQSK